MRSISASLTAYAMPITIRFRAVYVEVPAVVL
jgi:hypothetical protein